MRDYLDRKAVKLLAVAAQALAQAQAEALCDAPQRAVVLGLAEEARALLAEFADAYPNPPSNLPASGTLPPA